MIVSKFSDISKTKTGSEFLNKLPFEELNALIRDENLNVNNEIEVVKIIKSFIDERKTIVPLLEDEDPAKDLSHLTEEERKNREVLKAK